MAASRPAWLAPNHFTSGTRPVVVLNSTKYLSCIFLITEKSLSYLPGKVNSYFWIFFLFSPRLNCSHVGRSASGIAFHSFTCDLRTMANLMNWSSVITGISIAQPPKIATYFLKKIKKVFLFFLLTSNVWAQPRRPLDVKLFLHFFFKKNTPLSRGVLLLWGRQRTHGSTDYWVAAAPPAVKRARAAYKTRRGI